MNKPKVDGHVQRCRGATFSCVDCYTTFAGAAYRSHFSCITEVQKYETKKDQRGNVLVAKKAPSSGTAAVAAPVGEKGQAALVGEKGQAAPSESKAGASIEDDLMAAINGGAHASKKGGALSLGQIGKILKERHGRRAVKAFFAERITIRASSSSSSAGSGALRVALSLDGAINK